MLRRGLLHAPTSVALAVALVALTGCSRAAPSVLDGRSDAAGRVEELWWVMFWISAVVVGFVIVWVVVAAVRGRKEPREAVDKREVPWGQRFVVVAGLGVSGLILAGVFLLSLDALDDLSAPEDEPSLAIEVVSHNWWWEVRYPNGAATANEIRIPVGEPVELELTTADVIHSFWVPQLQVKKDHIPGMDNRLWLVADEAGRFRGQCAEFCGLQHAHMEFDVVAVPVEDFERWVTKEALPADRPATPAASQGRDVFLRSSCAGCHTVRGTSAVGTLGPDLTHFADRETLGAGLMPLTRGNVADFVANPQDDKPGVTMPPSEVTGAEFEALIDYLMQLD